jgi:hypothetical protein
MKLAKHNKAQLIWVLQQEGIEDNETANQLAKLGRECPLIGPEPACGISERVVKKAGRDWTNKDHKKYWEFITGLKTDRGIPKRTLSEEPRNR